MAGNNNPTRNDYDHDKFWYDEETDTLYNRDGDGNNYRGNGDEIDR